MWFLTETQKLLPVKIFPGDIFSNLSYYKFSNPFHRKWLLQENTLCFLRANLSFNYFSLNLRKIETHAYRKKINLMRLIMNSRIRLLLPEIYS